PDAQKWYVTQDPNRAPAGGKVFASVQQALAQAQPGDVILVLDDTLQEQLVLDDGKLGKGVTVQAGLSSDKEVRWLPPADLAPPTPLIRLANLEGFCLKGFTLDGEKPGLDTLITVSGHCPGLQLDNLQLRGFQQRALALVDCQGDKDAPVTLSRLR